jgi:hypothetical protein
VSYVFHISNLVVSISYILAANGDETVGVALHLVAVGGSAPERTKARGQRELVTV